MVLQKVETLACYKLKTETVRKILSPLGGSRLLQIHSVHSGTSEGFEVSQISCGYKYKKKSSGNKRTLAVELPAQK